MGDMDDMLNQYRMGLMGRLDVPDINSLKLELGLAIEGIGNDELVDIEAIIVNLEGYKIIKDLLENQAQAFKQYVSENDMRFVYPLPHYREYADNLVVRSLEKVRSYIKYSYIYSKVLERIDSNDLSKALDELVSEQRNTSAAFRKEFPEFDGIDRTPSAVSIVRRALENIRNKGFNQILFWDRGGGFEPLEEGGNRNHTHLVFIQGLNDGLQVLNEFIAKGFNDDEILDHISRYSGLNNAVTINEIISAVREGLRDINYGETENKWTKVTLGCPLGESIPKALELLHLAQDIRFESND